MFKDLSEFIFTRPWPKKISTNEGAARKADEMWEKINKGWKP